MITNKINTILNNCQQGDIDYTICNYIKMNLKEVAFMSIEEAMFQKRRSLNLSKN